MNIDLNNYFGDVIRLFAGYKNPGQIEKTLLILVKIIENIIKNSQDDKFRKISLKNNIINTCIVKIPGAVYFLRKICNFDLIKEDLRPMPKEISSLVKAGASLNRIGNMAIEYGLDECNDGQYLVYKKNEIKNLEYALEWLQEQIKTKYWQNLNNIIEIILLNGKSYKIGLMTNDTIFNLKKFAQRINNDTTNIELYLDNKNLMDTYNENDNILQLNKKIIRIVDKDKIGDFGITMMQKIKKKFENLQEKTRKENEIAAKITFEAKKTIKNEIEKNRLETIQKFKEDRLKNKLNL